MLRRSIGIGLLLATVTSCNKYVDYYSCLNPDRGHRDALNNPDPCHLNDPDSGGDGGSEPSCETGETVHWWHGWDSPSWVWFGPEDHAPECPQGPGSVSYEGHADLVALPDCEACTCNPPTGSCVLPSKLTASTDTCSASGGVSTPFNAHDPWDGTCDGSAQVPGGAAHSLTIDPIAMTENGCATGGPVAAKVDSLHWDTYARACDVHWPEGPTERSICLPADPPPPGFALCIFQNGANPCPTNAGNIFTDRHTFYQGVEDERQCSACTCGAPTGSACTAQLYVYEGPSCSGEPLNSNPISSTEPTCLDITIPGQALGSKSAGPTTYLPGTCPPGGGVASGTAIPTIPMTICCRP